MRFAELAGCSALRQLRPGRRDAAGNSPNRNVSGDVSLLVVETLVVCR